MKPILAYNFAGQNPKGWWMSEKLDGVRAIWDGSNLLSRNGKIFHAPRWFLEGLPKNEILDGELWQGRGLFQQTVGKVRTQYEPDWSGIKFVVFDVVNADTFEKRLQLLQTLDLPNHVKIVEQIQCKNREHLEHYKTTIIDSGGEGVMLRAAGSFYEHKRSNSLLKIKRMQTAEAKIVGYKKGNGKHLGRIGALICKYKGKLIRLGTGLTDQQREIPPQIGTKVTFSFFELTTAGMPRFPVFLAKRDYE